MQALRCNSGARKRGSNVNKLTSTGKEEQLSRTTEGDKCTICETIVKDEDKALCCDICEYWYHIKCIAFPDYVYDYMVKDEGGELLHWNCNDCKKGYEKIHNRLKALEIAQNDTSKKYSEIKDGLKGVKEDFCLVKEVIEKQVSEFNDRQDSFKEEIVIVKEAVVENNEQAKAFDARLGHMEAKFTEMQQSVSSVKAELNTENKLEKTYSEALMAEVEKKTEKKCKEVQKDLEKNLVEKATQNMQSRMNRKNNIVIYGAPEEMREDQELWLRSEKIKHDKAIVMELCSEIEVECYVDDIVEIKRVGQFKKKNETTMEEVAPRPIIVALKEGIKDNIMRSIFKLRNTENNMLKRMRVAHDMTLEERQTDKKLRTEAKEKNEIERGNFLYVVRGHPWERYILKVRKTRRTSVVPQTQEAAVPQEEGEEGA